MSKPVFLFQNQSHYLRDGTVQEVNNEYDELVNRLIEAQERDSRKGVSNSILSRLLNKVEHLPQVTSSMTQAQKKVVEKKRERKMADILKELNIKKVDAKDFLARLGQRFTKKEQRDLTITRTPPPELAPPPPPEALRAAGRVALLGDIRGGERRRAVLGDIVGGVAELRPLPAAAAGGGFLGAFGL